MRGLVNPMVTLKRDERVCSSVWAEWGDVTLRALCKNDYGLHTFCCL